MLHRVLLAASVLLLVLCVGSFANALCIGDCNGDGSVTVDELLKGVNITLDNAPLGDCPSFDASGDGAVTVNELLSAVNASLNACPTEPTSTPTSPPPTAAATATSTPAPVPVFPADYRATYTEVRDCRLSVEHGGVNIRVLANPIAAQPYLDETNPLPAGSIVVKEEFSGSGCDDANLVRWRAMRKEAAGFDPVDGDWHWQWVERDRSVTFDDKTTCIGCHARPACLARDRMCTVGGPPQVKFQLVLSRLPAALLSIAGTSPTDVYAVGADPGDDFGPYVLHYDGMRWRRLNTQATGDLWWVSVTPIDGAFYMAGANGLILRYDLSTGMFEKQTTPGTALLFGVWGSDANHIFAVGGDPNDEAHGGVVWRFDGSTWVVDNLDNINPQGVPTIFKVWGRSATDVYAVGREGLVLHFDGLGWSQVNSNSTSPLFTVHGNDTQVVAVGGDFQGEILEQDGEAFTNRAPAGAPQMNGVFIPPSGTGVAVGVGAAVALRNASGWQLQDTGLNTARDFHTTWIDPEGGIWAVGGDLSTALAQGILAYGGTRTIGSEIVPLALCPPPATPGGPTTVSYFTDIVPLLNTRGCLSLTCHGGPFPSSAYDLRSYDTIFGPGIEAKSLKACEVVPGNPDASFLIEKLGPDQRLGVRMPNDRPPLSSVEIDLLRTWIREGAQNDSPSTPTASPTRPITPSPTRPPVAGSPTATPTRTPTPTAVLTPAAACEQSGTICTMIGTGQSLFDGDGKPGLATSLYYPLGIAFDGLLRPLILDFNNLRVRRLNVNGSIETIMGKDYEDSPMNGALAIDTPLHHASDIQFDAQGNLYIAGDHAPVVFRVGADSRVFIVAGSGDPGYDGDDGPALQAKLTTPFGVLPADNGAFYISDVDAQVIRFVDSSGTIHTVAGDGTRGYGGDGGPATAAQLRGPTRMQRDADGNLYFCDTNNSAVRRVDVQGVITTVAGTGEAGYSGDNGPADQAQFSTPYDLRFAPNGDLYVADTGNNVIRRIQPNGSVTTVVGTGRRGFAGDSGGAQGCQLNRPSGLAFASDGSLWIADTFNERIRRVAQFLTGPS